MNHVGPFSTKEALWQRKKNCLALLCQAQEMKTGELPAAARSSQGQAVTYRKEGGVWDLQALFFSSGCVTSLTFCWNICQIFQNSVLLTSTLILNIAPTRQIWYKIYLGFVITMTWWYLELEKVIQGFNAESCQSLCQCPLFCLGASSKCLQTSTF